MKRRKFFKELGAAGAGVVTVPLLTSTGSSKVPNGAVPAEGFDQGVEIRFREGIPDLYIDGNRQSRQIGRDLSREGLNELMLRNISETKGIRFYIIDIFTNDNTLGWDGVDGFDHREYEIQIERYLKADPNLLLVLQCGLRKKAPFKWLEANEDQLISFEDGHQWAFPSYGSAKWRKDYCDALSTFVRHFDQSKFSKNIIGYIPVYFSNEWLHTPRISDGYVGDTSPAMLNHFRAWLKEKYNDDEQQLRTSWKQPQVSFDNAMVPSLEAYDTWHQGRKLQDGDGPYGFWVIDYRKCIHDTETQMKLATTSAVKNACNRKKLVGLMTGNQDYRVGASPDIDFFHKPQSYYNRNFGSGNFRPQHLIGSVHARGKMMLQQSDLNTHQCPDIINQHIVPPTQERNTHTEWQTLQTMTRDVACALQYQTGFYWLDGGPGQFWNWTADRFNVVNYAKFWFDSPAMREHIGKLQGLIDQNQSRQPVSAAEVAFISGLKSSQLYQAENTKRTDFTSIMNISLRNWGLADTAAPFDEYFLEDWDLIPKAYKVYIFPDAHVMTPELRDAIHQKLKKEKATAIWIYAPGYLADGKTDLGSMKALTGFEFTESLRNDLLQINLDKGDTLFRDITEIDFGSDVDFKYYAKDCNWFQWPKEEEVYKISPQFSVSHPKMRILGSYRHNSETGFAKIRYKGFDSVYVGAPFIPASVLRSLFVDAGVHLYADEKDLIYANSSMVAIRYGKDGSHTLRLPQKFQVVHALTQEVVAENEVAFTVENKYGATDVFWLNKTS